MPGKPANRITDSCTHMGAPMLPGTGAVNTLIGKKPAWRAVNPAAAAALQIAAKAADAIVKAGESAAKAAAAVPGGQPAAVAAETAAKNAALAVMNAAQSAAKIPTPSGGVADTHLCTMPSIGFAPIPHGPGMVIDGSKTVLVNGLPLSKLGCTILEAFGTPPPNKVVTGEFTVLIGG